ncbi:MAG: 4-hydroxy-3-methylbut-2-enyl diphosphate reductase [Christensenellales bacterium]
MEIIVAKNSGFCSGVKNAINMALKCGKCQTFGMLIHNEYALEMLKNHGVEYIDDLADYNGGKLIIRSHGVSKKTYQYLDSHGIDYIDATCVFVKKIHNIVAKYHDDGYRIIIIGDPSHPETQGINGWCDDSAIIIDNATDLDAITLDNCDKYCVVAQTTFDHEKFEKIVKILEKCLKIVVIHNTICYTTTSRQNEAFELSKKCDAMLVIGSKNSSNTRKLYGICQANCPRTYYVETASDVKTIDVAKNLKKLGIIAGASTPEELIKEVITQMDEISKKDEFGAMLEQSESKTKEVKAGKIFKDCKVVSANEDGIVINFGGKKDGFIDKTEVEVDGVEYNPDNYKEGDVIAAIVVEKSGNKKNNDCISFSKKAYDFKTIVAKESEEKLRSSEFKAEVESVVKNGLKTHVGPYEVFIPASQIRIGFVTEEDLKKYVGKTLRLRAIKGKNDNSEGEIEIKRHKTVIASQRVILEEEKKAKEDALWEVLVTGNVVTGKVRRFADFGAFVNVNGFDCLVHISDISHYKIAHPSEVLELNKSYEFVILKADRESQKVSLGYKQLQKKPYEIAAEKYPVGSVVTGTVRTVLPYGAFVLIERDVDGLIPVSEIAHTFTKSATDVYKEGDVVTAKVIKFEGNKITLSAKALIDKPEEKEEEISEEELQAAKEKRASKASKKFDSAAAVARKPKAKKEEKEEEEVTSWTSEQVENATFKDLFKGFVFDTDDNADKE